MSIIAGFHSGHDCSFCILKDGVPVIHAELERYIRLKEPIDDSVKFSVKDTCNYFDYLSGREYSNLNFVLDPFQVLWIGKNK